ncbi:DNA polymerase III subunit epsilon [Sabulicella glaciei]|uniref:DNA polymerase III subunit epsilon n=1 Tax=Sabulicella glaciei TaxID=2984948 RepID=A0ABT3NWG4_9PROT|nr:DNA polymerase III subunit epsilon [Roseococcus sp. MDT2-1-1]MCW8086502.1 DNA polymerase III subunit epsilon [Roseococcus sp. MDT2-1-1]
MTREIVLDTETTGFEPEEGHRVIEIAAIELVNLLPTGRYFHTLVDPQRDVPPESTRVHGFTRADLQGKPLFAAVAQEMLDFLADAPIVAHNAPFDFKHLDAELVRAGLPPLDPARMVDSLVLARERFPGAPNSLDALCRRFGIDLSERTTHNALLDVRLLASAYLELRGGRQGGLALDEAPMVAALVQEERQPRTPLPIIPTSEQEEAHRAFLASAVKDAIWLRG